MKEIKFNKNYKKLHNQKTACLIQTAVVKGIDIPKDFIEYDTDNSYKINKRATYLLLVFVGNKIIPFTTLRKLNIENVKKYIGHEGDYFDIIVEEEPLPNHWVPM